MEAVLGVQRQATDLGAQLIAGNDAGLCAIAIQAEAAQVRRRQLDGVPLEHDAGLCRVAASQNRRRWGARAKGVEDFALQRSKLLVGYQFRMLVAHNVDVDDAAGVDVGREQDGWKLDLRVEMLAGGSQQALRGERHHYQAFILGQKHRNTGVNFTDCERDEHDDDTGILFRPPSEVTCQSSGVDFGQGQARDDQPTRQDPPGTRTFVLPHISQLQSAHSLCKSNCNMPGADCHHVSYACFLLSQLSSLGRRLVNS